MIAIGAARVRRIATTGCLAAVLAVVLPGAFPPPPAAALESDSPRVSGSERPAREGASRITASEDPRCVGLDARDIAELRHDPGVRAQLDELCRATATMKYADEKPFPYPLWAVVVLAVVGIGTCWYYFVRRGTGLPWWHGGWG